MSERSTKIDTALSREKSNAAALVGNSHCRAAVAAFADDTASVTQEIQIGTGARTERNVAGRWCGGDDAERRIERDPNIRTSAHRRKAVISALLYLAVKENVARSIFGQDGHRFDICQRDRTLARDSRSDESAADVGHAQVADTRFDIDHRCVRHADREINVPDVVPALIIANQIDYDRARKILGNNDRRGSFEIGGDIDLGSVPANDGYSSGAVH